MPEIKKEDKLIEQTEQPAEVVKESEKPGINMPWHFFLDLFKKATDGGTGDTKPAAEVGDAKQAGEAEPKEPKEPKAPELEKGKVDKPGKPEKVDKKVSTKPEQTTDEQSRLDQLENAVNSIVSVFSQMKETTEREKILERVNANRPDGHKLTDAHYPLIQQYIKPDNTVDTDTMYTLVPQLKPPTNTGWSDPGDVTSVEKTDFDLAFEKKYGFKPFDLGVRS